MRPDSAWPELRAHIAGRLDPPGGEPEPPAYSDWDLNPDWRPPGATRAPAAVLIPIVEHPGGPTVLLTRRSDALSKHAGQVAFPGGRVDPGETPEAAALREADEEIGLPAAAVTVAGRSTPYETITAYAVTPVVGFVRPGFALTLNTDEVADAFEAPFAMLMNPASYERRFFEGADRRRRYYYAVPWKGQLIWGATAGMLRALGERLFGPSASSG